MSKPSAHYCPVYNRNLSAAELPNCGYLYNNVICKAQYETPCDAKKSLDNFLAKNIPIRPVQGPTKSLELQETVKNSLIVHNFMQYIQSINPKGAL